MNFQKNSIKLIVCIFLVVLSRITMAQIHVINADSLKLGEIAGTNGIAFYGRPYFKNIGLGKVSDSILVRQIDGQIKFVPRSLIVNSVGVEWANISGRPIALSQFNNDSGFITASGSVNYATTAGSANSVAWTNVSSRPGALSQFNNDLGFITASGSVNYAATAGSANSVAWTNVSGRPSALSQFNNDSGFITASGSVNFSAKSGSTTTFMSASHPDVFYLQNNWDGSRWNITSNHGAPARVGYADEAGSISWGNVSGRPSAISSFTNDAGYVTAGGNVNYSNSSGVANSVAWANVSGRPSALSSFSNDAGYLTAGGSINYANSSGVAGSTQNFMSSSHPETYFLVNNWDGARWNITSNHGAPVRVGWADGAGSVDWSNISNKPSNYAVSGGPISQFDNDYDYARSQNINLASVTNRGSDTPLNLYLYKGMSDNTNEGSGITFSSEGGTNPSYSSIWQLGSGGAMINKGSSYGWWETNLRIEANGEAYLRGQLHEGSDARLKKNIKKIKSISANLRAVQAVEYDRIDSKAHHMGFIAQDFQKIFPDLVTHTGGTKDMLGIAYSNFTAPLLKGWQEHDDVLAAHLTKIKALEDKLTTQKNELKSLKEELKQLKELLKPIIK